MVLYFSFQASCYIILIVYLCNRLKTKASSKTKSKLFSRFYFCKNNKMIPLNLPDYEIKLSGSPTKPMIFDILRGKYVALTPEEWVRQHFVHFLINHKGYPATLLANEVKLNVGDKKLRADTVLYSRQLKPQVIIEYKAPQIEITQKVFDQIMVYNMLLHVDYLIVSNGIKHYCCKIDYNNQKYLYLEDIPNYDIILQNEVGIDSK
jgi:type I restriction enzyme R protein N-terminal domain protein